MTVTIDRRALLQIGALGVSALAVPGLNSVALALARATGFTHSVASGEPASDSLLLWTRYVPQEAGPVELRVELSDDPNFTRTNAGGAVITGPWRDYTAKIVVSNLKPNQPHYYRFVAPDGSLSPVGRAKTLPDGVVQKFTAAVFSCSNLGFGWFNAYAHAARRNDLDLAIHLGDYIYEYAPGAYPSLAETVAGRIPEPHSEAVSLADYRLRYASYRADADLRALHERLAVIAQWDDHEAANDAWEGGAQNHDPSTEGSWSTRRAAAIQAWHEWMPVSEQPWKSYDIAGLATIVRTDTRLLARSQRPSLAEAFKAGNPTAALREFRDRIWPDPARTMMGSDQENWLAHALKSSVRSGRRWQIVCSGSVVGRAVTPPEADGWSTRNNGDADYLRRSWLAGREGLPFLLDQWDGYPAARSRLLRSAQEADANLVVISGDSHNAWSFNLAERGDAAGVEFAGQSVTSSGYEALVATDPARVSAAMVRANPELVWCDTSRRGYMALTLTPAHAYNEWLFFNSVQQRDLSLGYGHRAHVAPGRRRIA